MDSGASDTVVQPHAAWHLPLLHSPKVGVGYEVANGGVIVNLGERRATAKTKVDRDASIIVSFQVIEVHKPFLAVSRLVETGHKSLFDKVDPDILLSTGEKVGMTCVGGTYEIEILIEHPGFTRQNLR